MGGVAPPPPSFRKAELLLETPRPSNCELTLREIHKMPLTRKRDGRAGFSWPFGCFSPFRGFRLWSQVGFSRKICSQSSFHKRMFFSKMIAVWNWIFILFLFQNVFGRKWDNSKVNLSLNFLDAFVCEMCSGGNGQYESYIIELIFVFLLICYNFSCINISY